MLKLAHEAVTMKVTSCEPLMGTSTTSTTNALLQCASSSNSSTHKIATSCDELLFLPCCSNIVASTSSSIFVETNHVGGTQRAQGTSHFFEERLEEVS